jgi:hypothetical protein
VYGKFKKGKTLTTQVVRNLILKREEGLHQGFHNQNYQRGRGRRSEEEEGTYHHMQRSF